MITVGNWTAQDVGGNLVVSLNGTPSFMLNGDATLEPLVVTDSFSTAKKADIISLWAYNYEDTMHQLYQQYREAYEATEEQPEPVEYEDWTKPYDETTHAVNMTREFLLSRTLKLNKAQQEKALIDFNPI